MVSICFSSAGRWPWEEVWMRGEEVRGRGGGEGPGRRYG